MNPFARDQWWQVGTIDFFKLELQSRFLMSEERKYPSQVAERFNIRLPGGMRELIRQASEKNGRSMNVEIIHRLQSSFEEPAFARELVESIEVLKALTGSVVEVTELDGVQRVTFERPIPKRD